jgi:hypothetical protein
MIEKTLEIRGINRDDLITYLIQLKGNLIDNEIQTTISGKGWRCTLSEEEHFLFLQSNIPKVFVTFSAADSQVLEQIIKDFRLKTFRAGG